MPNFEISVLVFLQIAIILGVCRLVGRLVRPLGQPQVVGEMITGVLLGPSLFGLLLPDLQARLFPKPTLTVIYCLAQIGLALYMFLVGLEFDVGLIRNRMKSALSVSWAGTLTPFFLGCGVAWLLRDRFPLFAPDVKSWEAMLFMGAAMSITAFPMLARIIYERGLVGTSLGTLALAAGALGDAVAWCVLAIVLASFTGNLWIAVFAIGGGLLYALLTLTLGRGWLERLFVPREADDKRRGTVIPLTLILVTACAWLTDSMGIYAVFGAFILGVAMPRGAVARHIEEAMTPLTTGLLVPMFFISSGLNTRIGLLDSPGLWAVAVLVLLVACLGKGIACGLAARLNGEPPRESFAIGALMNCRGLTELILLNIGLERGIITPTLFAVMVLMAITTTLMAMPAFNLAYGRATGAEIEARRVGGVGV
ncbi:MAG TPA: cation:proton antiporter [Thermoanaerobaculia bacterium]|jgi:Kef-type K+ transport system membrane component KefB|nr:cation:proton antiporter [Thermoanaerobaculia bacterium]